MSKVDFRLPNFDYILETFPGQNIESNRMIYHRFLWPNESVWLGPVPKNALSIHSDRIIFKTLVNYFQKQLWNISYDKHNTTNENIEAKDFTKLVWLTREYFTVGFKTYFSAHYNPRLGIQAIHPGGGRQSIYRLFDPSPDIRMFYFNTGGTDWPWLENCERLSYDQIIKLGYLINFVADHGSFIPHLFWDDRQYTVTTTRLGVAEVEPWLQQRITEIKINCNQRLPDYLNPIIDNQKFNVKLRFNKFSRLNLLRAMLLIINRLPSDRTDEYVIKYVE